MNHKKRYYFLVNSLEGWWAEWVILRLARELVSRAEVDIITLKSERFYDLPEWVNHIALSGIKSHLLMFLFFPFYVWKVRRYLKLRTYTGGISFLEFSNFIHIFSRKDAIISFRTSLDFFHGYLGNIYRILIRILYPLAGTIIVNSKENAIEMERRLNIAQWKIITLPNPVDMRAIEKAQEEIAELPHYDQEKQIFITVGRLTPSKHHIDIIHALAEWKKQFGNIFHYYIIWDGPERVTLERAIIGLDLDKEVSLLGSKKNVFPYLMRADYFLYASEAEWFPNVLLEALVCWLPIITTDFRTGAREVIFWEYREDITLPIIGPNGMLLRPRKFEEDFIALWKKIDTVQQHKQWLGHHEIQRVAQTLETLLSH